MQEPVFPKDELNRMKQQLKLLAERSLDRNGLSHSFLETELESGELRINGNSFGLLDLAVEILDIAAKDFTGAHIHLDDTVMIGRCDMPVVFALKNAE
jgi:hypothetical protein